MTTGGLSDLAFSRGDIMHRLQVMERRIAELEAAKRLQASTMQGGVLRLAGTSVMEALGDEEGEDAGERILEMSAGEFGVRRLIAGAIDSPDVLRVLHPDEELDLHVNSATGSDDTGDGSAGNPFETIQTAIDEMPRYVNGTASIIIHQDHVEEGGLNIEGFSGGGRISLLSQSPPTRPKVNGEITIRGCTPHITLDDLQIHPDEESDHSAAVYISRCLFVSVRTCLLRGDVTSGVQAQRCKAEVIGCDVRGTARGVFAVRAGDVYVNNGTGSVTGVALWANSSTIYVSGTRWSAPTAVTTQNGGIVSGTITEDPTPPPPPPANTTVKTSRFNATRTESWRSSPHNRWRFRDSHRANSFVYQGEWGRGGNHRGLWFFNSSAIRSALAGRKIRRVRFRVTRRGAGGNAAGVRPTFRLHNMNAPGSGRPGVFGDHPGPPIRWGQTATVTLPVTWGARLKEGSARGIAIYTPNGNPYMIFQARGTLIIEHEG